MESQLILYHRVMVTVMDCLLNLQQVSSLFKCTFIVHLYYLKPNSSMEINLKTYDAFGQGLAEM